ncbi:MAG TPA: hypothetical protein VF432_29630 [Thermoanaerobaculia bacterium]
MFRRLSIVFSVILFATAVNAQWQPCTPGTSVCQTTGNVGIGTTNPSQALDVNGNVRGNSFASGGSAPTGYPFFAAASSTLTGAGIQLRSNYGSTEAATVMGNFGNYGTYVTQNRDPNTGAFPHAAAAPNQYRATQLVLGDSIRGRLFQVTNFPGGQEAVRLLIDFNGNVGIGTLAPTERLDVNGNINVSGNINAKYQDVAEWVEAPTKFEAGTVVVLDPARSNGVVASTSTYDTSAAGVVSARPGISLGEKSDSKILVATTGRVRVKVDATHEPIRIGDLLVTSDIPGTAMKSAPIDVAGFPMHRPGTLIGKALEPLDSGRGEILVLLSLQ